MNDTHDRDRASDRRALVVAGGGAAGHAWEIGLLAGLAEAGVDLTTADLVVGTSAGSTVAAQVTSGSRPAGLYAAILAEVPPSPAAGDRPAGAGERRHAPPVSGPSYLDWSNAVIAASEDAADMRRRMGAAALARAAADRPSRTPWREIVAARLPSREWPPSLVRITAVDARTGEPVVFDRHGDVELVDAVAASTSAMTPYAIGEDRYLNGGYRRSENADLAAGYDRVVVLSPFSGRTRMPLAWGMDLATQVAELRAGGSRVESRVPGRGCRGRLRRQRPRPLDPSSGRPRRLRPGPGPRRDRRRRLVLNRSGPSETARPADGLDARDLEVRRAVGFDGQPHGDGRERTAGDDVAAVGHDLEIDQPPS